MIHRCPKLCSVIAWLTVLVAQAAGASGIGTWVEGGPRAIGATRDSFNHAAGLAWDNRMGDWVDRNGKPQGATPWAKGKYKKGNNTIDLDVTRLHADYLAHSTINQGFFLRVRKPSAPMAIHSREAKNPQLKPRLTVRYKNGSVEEFEPTADVAIHASSYRSDGSQKTMKLQPGRANILMRFPVDKGRDYPAVESAHLRLTIAKSFGNKKGVVELYRVAPGQSASKSAPIPGFAKNYVGDQGIDTHPGVYFATDFAGRDWKDVIGKLPRMARILETRKHGSALGVTVPKGKTLGLNKEISFSSLDKTEPTRVFFRYYVKFENDWRPAVGGKLPGIAGTYGKAGWGGRRASGKNGWSARGGFRRSMIDGDGSLHVPLTSYVYYPDSKNDPYGVHFSWGIAQRGVLRAERWYCVEQELKLNTPGKKDGYLNVWVDGRPALKKAGMRFRDTDKLKIEKIWLNVYHGGTTRAPANLNMLIDNIVVADRYIGPAMLPYTPKDWWNTLE